MDRLTHCVGLSQFKPDLHRIVVSDAVEIERFDRLRDAELFLAGRHLGGQTLRRRSLRNAGVGTGRLARDRLDEYVRVALWMICHQDPSRPNWLAI